MSFNITRGYTFLNGEVLTATKLNRLGDGTFGVDTLAALEAVDVSDLVTGDAITMLGYYSVGDGGGGTFYYDSASVVSANGGTVIAPDVGSGRWIRIYSGDVDVRWFGAKGDNSTDDTIPINNAVAYTGSVGGRLVFGDGDYVTNGILVVSNIWIDFQQANIKKFANGSSIPTNCLIRAVETLSGSTYYGTYENIKITGGYLYANGKTCPANMVRLLFIEGLILEGVTIAEYAAAVWGFCLGGNNIRVEGCRTIGGDALFEDGMHVMFGDNVTISDCDLESGDDAIALGSEPTDPYTGADPFPLRYVSVSNCNVKSEKGSAIKIYVQSGATGANWEVTDVSISGITGQSGITRNGGIALLDLNGGVPGTSQIQRITITNVDLAVGSTAHDESNPIGVWVRSLKQLILSNITLVITEKTSASTGFDFARIEDSQGVVFDNPVCDELQKRFGIDINDCEDVTIKGGLLRETALTTVGSPIRMIDAIDTKIIGMSIYDVKDGGSGILVTSGTDTNAIITDCLVTQEAGSTAGQAVGVVSTAFTHLTITDNDFTGCFSGVNGGSLTPGASFLVSDNAGLITMSQGTATVANGATTTTVTHSLALTPALSQIQVVPTNNLGTATKFWISTPTSTQFTINVDADPGATTATFAWYANVGKKPV